MEKTKEEKIALINETVAYYSEDPLRRCFYESGECFYSGTNNKNATSEGCAIGRLIPKELAEELDKEFFYDIGNSGVKEIFDRLPIDLQAYGVKFLSELQGLHDNPEYWREHGLSDEGAERVELLIYNLMNDI